MMFGFVLRMFRLCAISQPHFPHELCYSTRLQDICQTCRSCQICQKHGMCQFHENYQCTLECMGCRVLYGRLGKGVYCLSGSANYTHSPIGVVPYIERAVK